MFSLQERAGVQGIGRGHFGPDSKAGFRLENQVREGEEVVFAS